MTYREKLLLRDFSGRTPMLTASYRSEAMGVTLWYAHANKRHEGSLVSHMPDQVSRLSISM